MKTPTLKSYLKNNLLLYLKYYKNSSLRFSWLYLKSKKDSRLAELAQGYFLSTNQQEKSNLFSKYTFETFKSYKEYASSESKYPYQFRKMVKAKQELKNQTREQVLKLIKKYQVSLYKVSKQVNTNQSNVSCFFNKKQNQKLSQEKLNKLVRIYVRYNKLKETQKANNNK